MKYAMSGNKIPTSKFRVVLGITIFQGKQKHGDFLTTRPALQKMVQGALNIEGRHDYLHNTT